MDIRHTSSDDLGLPQSLPPDHKAPKEGVDKTDSAVTEVLHRGSKQSHQSKKVSRSSIRPAEDSMQAKPLQPSSNKTVAKKQVRHPSNVQGSSFATKHQIKEGDLPEPVHKISARIQNLPSVGAPTAVGLAPASQEIRDPVTELVENEKTFANVLTNIAAKCSLQDPEFLAIYDRLKPANREVVNDFLSRLDNVIAHQNQMGREFTSILNSEPSQRANLLGELLTSPDFKNYAIVLSEYAAVYDKLPKCFVSEKESGNKETNLNDLIGSLKRKTALGRREKATMANDIVAPVQRVMRYPLTFNEIAKNTESLKPALANLRAIVKEAQEAPFTSEFGRTESNLRILGGGDWSRNLNNFVTQAAKYISSPASNKLKETAPEFATIIETLSKNTKALDLSGEIKQLGKIGYDHAAFHEIVTSLLKRKEIADLMTNVGTYRDLHAEVVDLLPKTGLAGKGFTELTKVDGLLNELDKWVNTPSNQQPLYLSESIYNKDLSKINNSFKSKRMNKMIGKESKSNQRLIDNFSEAVEKLGHAHQALTAKISTKVSDAGKKVEALTEAFSGVEYEQYVTATANYTSAWMQLEAHQSSVPPKSGRPPSTLAKKMEHRSNADFEAPFRRFAEYGAEVVSLNKKTPPDPELDKKNLALHAQLKAAHHRILLKPAKE